jgi:cyanophycinase-like exopeptidase
MSGRLVIVGSGETAPTMVSTHRAAIRDARASEIVIVDTTYGFQENADHITAKLVEFFDVSLRVPSTIASLRSHRVEPVEVERFRTILQSASAVFAGPGSPSYALGVWREHDVGALFRGVISRGGTVTLASAAALTAGTRTIPVYEVYKVGSDPYWLPGLDVLSVFGLEAVVVPHWNNTEGGDHDTSRCFMGQRRFDALVAELDHGVIGVDEHTALTFDLEAGVMQVAGKGVVTLLGEGTTVVESGSQMDLHELAAIVGGGGPALLVVDSDARPVSSFEEALRSGDVDGVIRAMLAVEESINDAPDLRPELRSMIVQLGDVAGRGLVDPRAVVGGFIDLLLELRRDAREARRFDESDRIREGLAELGVEVRDTRGGAEWDLGEEIQNP